MVYKRQLDFKHSYPSGCDTSKLLSDDLKNKLYYDGFQKVLYHYSHQSSRTEPEAEEKPDARPSVLAALEEKADKVEPVRPFKSYLDKDGDAR